MISDDSVIVTSSSCFRNPNKLSNEIVFTEYKVAQLLQVRLLIIINGNENHSIL